MSGKEIEETAREAQDMLTLKAALSVDVSQMIIDQNMVHTSLVLKEVDWFFNRMGLDDSYFLTTSSQKIAMHISSIYAGKILAVTGGHEHDFKINQIEKDDAFFAVRSIPGSPKSQVFELERLIDSRFLLEGYGDDPKKDLYELESEPYRVKVFRSEGPISEELDIQLRFYMLARPTFPEGPVDTKETDLLKISDPRMLERTSPNTQKIIREHMNEIVHQLGPVIRVYKGSMPHERRLVISYHNGSTHSFFSAITDLYHGLRLYSPKKFVEQFKNGITTVSVYLRPIVPDLKSTHDLDQQSKLVDERLARVIEDVSLVYVLPRTSMSQMFQDNILNACEVAYAYVTWKFAHQFLSRYRREYFALVASVEKNDPASLGHLLRLRQHLRKDTFTEQRLREVIMGYPELIRLLYADFAERHGPASRGKKVQPGVHSNDALASIISKSVQDEFDLMIFNALLTFNCHVLKTNFYKKTKIALSFRLSPEFLPVEEYPVTPYGIFFVVGSEFRGFHVRFTDVARGGVRIIRSRNLQAFVRNVGIVFNENYDLASTQQSKNKDIPEGGSKGTIFLSLNHQDKASVAFRKYVDSLLDILLPSDETVDYLQKDEILFLGPDEGTADMMDWASQHARSRGAHFWKAFTTGKSVSLGGIPHDMFGMTTRSVHQYVLGILEKLGWDESTCTKFQTGGPDGDLGSNEILISKDRTIAIVDGSGVLVDPKGIDRVELTRLAKNRQMCEHFDKTKLSPQGYFVHIDQRDVTLPDGTTIENGLVFRNHFHLNPAAEANIFVPCGGRPEAVDLNNVDQLFLDNGKPRFKVIVEGANLFFTQQARLKLEQSGVIIYKDASANKGGVTSSSLEVLAALALTDEEFAEHMQVFDGVKPAFYEQYVKEVQTIIELNARLEFDCIWNEHELTGSPRCVITDKLSGKINSLNKALTTSKLWHNLGLRNKVLSRACPPSLIKMIGLEALNERVPLNYIQAIFGAHLAATYVYKYGLSASEFAFFDFIDSYINDG